MAQCICQQALECPVHPYQQLPIGVCDACAGNLPTTYLTVSLHDTQTGSVETYRVCTVEHAVHLHAAFWTPHLGLRYEARNPWDSLQFVIIADEAA